MLKIQKNHLIAGSKKFAFPAVRLSINSKVYEITGEGKAVAAPLPGTVMKINVAVGDQVDADTTLLILEAVKMENEIKAGFAGTVKEISVAQGGVVAAGDTLVVIEG